MKKTLLMGCLLAFLYVCVQAQTIPPVLTAASNATVDNDFEITFPDDANWRDSISQIQFGSDVLPTAAYDVTQAGKIIFQPAQSAILRIPKSDLLTISANSYSDATVTQEIHHGEARTIVITIQPEGPPNNTEQLDTQPEVKLQDQYNNDCTENNTTTVDATASGGTWTLGGTVSIQVTNGVAAYTDLTAQSDAEVPAATISFSGTGLTTVESNSFVIPAPLVPPGLLASSTATVDATFEVTFANNASWQGNITDIYYGGNLLSTASYDKSQQGKIILDPSQDSDLQQAGTAEIKVTATGYSDATVNQTIQPGNPQTIIIATQPEAPVSNGGILSTQPAVKFQDQYGNDCTNESSLEISAARGDSGNWTLGGTLTQSVTNGVLSYSDLTASSSNAVTGARIDFSADGFTTASSNPFDIPDRDDPPALTAQSGATVDNNIIITFTDNTDWRDNISSINYGGNGLKNEAWEVSSDSIILKPAQDTLLQKAGSHEVQVLAVGYNTAIVTQEVQHGTAAALVITRQPGSPEYNGGQLSPQPVVEYRDQYDNICTGEPSQMEVTKGDSGDWTLGGITSAGPDNGAVEFTDLTASSSQAFSGASLQFSSGSLAVVSETFNIEDLKTPPELFAAISATVDTTFEVTFVENLDWQGNISEIYYGDMLLSIESYNKNLQGTIRFDPSKDSDLQLARTTNLRIVSGGYSDATVEQTISHGSPDTLIITVQPESPEFNSGLLSTQPEVKFQDQYGNNCTNENNLEISAAPGDIGNWTLGGTLSETVTNGVLTYSDLTATSNAAVTGAIINFSANDLTTVSSAPFDIPDLNDPPALTAHSGATVDGNIVITFTDNDDWREKITAIHYNGNELNEEAWELTEGEITLMSDLDTLLQKTGGFEVRVFASGYNDATVTQEVQHGVATALAITRQPGAPEYNGGQLSPQPVVEYRDQYDNVCISETTQLEVSKSDDGDWTLGGTVIMDPNNGAVEYLDLTGSSPLAVEGASLQFSSVTLTVVSDTFSIMALQPPPALSAASGANVDTTFAITFTEDSVWRSRINQITFNDSILETTSYDISQTGKIVFDPSKSEYLQKVGIHQVIISSTGFFADSVEQEIFHGKTVRLAIDQQPEGPENNGEELAQQPVILLQDQYENNCTSDGTTRITTSKADTLDWVYSGTFEVQAESGVVSYTGLKAKSEIAIDSARLRFAFDQDTIISEAFKIPVPVIELIAADPATVDNEFSITFEDNASWRDSITSVSYGGNQLADTAYRIEPGALTFIPSLDTLLQIAGQDSIQVVANGYANSNVLQKIQHGKVDTMLITTQPVGPEKNGAVLETQPELLLKDQYKNDCTTDTTTTVIVSKYSDGSDSDVSALWQLGGTLELVALKGIISFTDLTATSENKVDGARLLFESDELPEVVSDSFNIVVPDPPVITPAANVTVDASFQVHFTDNATWRSLITDIKYGIRSLEGHYDVSVPGIITFDPQMASVLQKSGVDSMHVYAEGYKTSSFEQQIGHGIGKYLVILKQPSPPEVNGDVLFRQPVLKLQDQYRNDCKTDNETSISVRKGDTGTWTLSGTLMEVAQDGIIRYHDLAVSSSEEVDGARLEFNGTGIIPLKSARFTIPAPLSYHSGKAQANPEMVCMGSKSNITLVDYQGAIQWQKWNENTESYQDVDGQMSELFITEEIYENARYRARVDKEGTPSRYSNAVTVSVIEPPVAGFEYLINFNVVDFENQSRNITEVVWDFGDGSQSTELNPSHTYFLDGKSGEGFTVKLTASNQSCPDDIMKRQVFIATGIDDLENENGLIIYPNPNQGIFQVNLNGNHTGGTLRIVDAFGHVILARQLSFHDSFSEISFDLSKLSPGLYFVLIHYGDEMLKSRFIMY